MRSLNIEISIVDKDWIDETEAKTKVVAYRNFTITPFVSNIADSRQTIHRCVDKIIDYIQKTMEDK